jgi:hypothetical protein
MAETIVTAEIGPAAGARFSYVDWPAIVAGAVVGSAVAFVLTAFGTALGLSIVSPYRAGAPGTGIVIAAGLWLLWVAGLSYFAAGYVAGRLRQRLLGTAEHEVRIRDGVHGIIAWGLATLIGAALLVFGVYGAGNIASRVAPAAADAAPAAAAAMRDERGARGSEDNATYAIPIERMFGPGDENAKPGADAARRTAARIMTASVAAGNMARADHEYLTKLVAARSGVTEAEARTRVDQAFTESRALADKAKQAANAARKLGIVAAFAVAASLLLGLVAAWWAADRGGRHRDQNTVFSFLQFR